MEEIWSKKIQVRGQTFVAVCFRRPFREGLEVQIDVDGTILTVAELGYGESALLEKVRAVVEEYLRGKNS